MAKEGAAKLHYALLPFCHLGAAAEVGSQSEVFCADSSPNSGSLLEKTEGPSGSKSTISRSAMRTAAAACKKEAAACSSGGGGGGRGEPFTDPKQAALQEYNIHSAHSNRLMEDALALEQRKSKKAELQSALELLKEYDPDNKERISALVTELLALCTSAAPPIRTAAALAAEPPTAPSAAPIGPADTLPPPAPTPPEATAGASSGDRHMAAYHAAGNQAEI